MSNFSCQTLDIQQTSEETVRIVQCGTLDLQRTFRIVQWKAETDQPLWIEEQTLWDGQDSFFPQLSFPHNATPQCALDAHDQWGPVIAEPCLRGGFGMTLLFEEGILTIVPLVIALIFTGLQILSLRHAATKARKDWLFYVKLALYVLYAVFQKSLLDFWTNTDAPTTRLTIPTTTLVIVSFLIFPILSWLGHVRSLQPSNVLTLYLGTSAGLDLTRLRTLSDIPGSNSVTTIYLAALAVKVVLFFAELAEKRHLLLEQYAKAGPEETSGAINRAFFVWVNAVFAKGYKSILTVDNLPVLDKQILDATKPRSLEEKWAQADKSSKNALLWLYIKHYKWSLLSGVLPRLSFSAFSFAEPLLVEKILDFTSEAPSDDRHNIAQGLIAGYAIMHVGKAVAYTLYEHRTYRAITQFRGSLVTMIFGKTLALSSTDIADAEAITLMSADIGRIESSMHIMHDIYAAFIDLIISMFLLYRLIGGATYGPAVWIVSCLFLGMPIAKAAGNAQVPWLESIEERLAVTTKMLGSMKAIKMTGLTEMMSSIVTNLRNSEIDISRKFRALAVMESGASYLSSTFTPVIGFALFTILSQRNGGKPLTEAVAFAALGLFQLQEQPLVAIVGGVEHLHTILNSFSRIQDHLVQAERRDPRIVPGVNSYPYFVPAYHMDTDRLLEIEPKYDETEMSMAQQSLYDTKIAITVQNVSAGYSAQSDIFRNLSFKVARGKTTMIIGPVGSGKSTLLRLLLGEMPFTTGAVATAFTNSAFCPQSPWITWGTIQKNIQGMSKWDPTWYKTVARVCSLTRDFEELPDGDQTNTGTRGSRLSGGQQMRVSLARALYSKRSLMILDDVLTGLDRSTEASILNAAFGKDGLVKQLGSTVVLATNSVAHLNFADHIIVLNEDGTIAEQGTLEEVSAAGGYASRLANLPAPSTARPELELSKETLEELELPGDDEEFDMSRSAGDFQVYKYYVQLAGPGTFLFYLLACAAFVFGLSFPSIWLQWWTNSNKEHPNENSAYWLSVYASLAALALGSCMLSDYIFRIILLPKTSTKFHELLLGTTVHANTAFLTSTDAGQTTNRFSQDLQLIDHDLPMALDQTIINIFSVIVSSVLVFMGSGYTAASIPVCCVLLFIVQFFYLRTSRQLRLLNIEAKAPLFSQFLETLSGVSCIRAYGWTEDYIVQGYEVLDKSQRPYYLMGVIQRWLTLVLQLMVGGIGVLMVTFATTLPNGSAAFLGVALFKVIDFSSTLENFVSQWTMLETSLGAISRIRTFVEETKSEDLPHETDYVPFDWPQKGAVTFNNISASYSTSVEPVLKKIKITVEPGQKIAVCGRTGSGKSSLVSTLLRMLELEDGSINIDGIDISRIPRQEVRRRLNTLPQEPFFVRGTVRENADPLGVASDEDIIEGLKAARLWDSIEKEGGLDGELNEERLSHGQRQLFCLVRAVVKPGKIVIMDEATSSVDADTDELIQGIIRKSFSDRTLIVIAHKLDTVLDFDRVALLSKAISVPNVV
ncbi:unnamed protein product, partial [Clonostachys chloroleuca]